MTAAEFFFFLDEGWPEVPLDSVDGPKELTSGRGERVGTVNALPGLVE